MWTVKMYFYFFSQKYVKLFLHNLDMNPRALPVQVGSCAEDPGDE